MDNKAYAFQSPTSSMGEALGYIRLFSENLFMAKNLHLKPLQGSGSEREHASSASLASK